MTDEQTELIYNILPRLPGWCTPDKGKRLAQLVTDARADLCVELGVFGGRSLVAIALGLARNGFGEVHGIDPFEKKAALEGRNSPENDVWWSAVDFDDVMRQAAAAIDDNGLREYAKIVRAKSLDVVDSYEDGSIDVIHQDGNHSEDVSVAEVLAYAPKVALGGFWVMDDTNWETTVRAQGLLVELGFQLVEPHGAWEIFQAVGVKLKGR